MAKNIKLIIFAIFLIILFSYSYFIEPNKLEVNHYTVNSPDIKGVKIVFASDFHVKPYGQKRLEKIVQKINAENPDLVLSVGDFVSGHTSHSTMPIEDIAKTLTKIKPKYGFYTTLGNHDGWYNSDKITQILKENGINVLSNQNFLVNINGQKMYIAGIEDIITGKPDILKVLNNINDTYPIILLTHSPDMFPNVPENIMLTLAGHTHGGQIRIPFLGAIFTASNYGKKYVKGWVQEKNNELIVTDTSKRIQLKKKVKTLFITRGIGVSILPLRFNCPPEIVVIEFE